MTGSDKIVKDLRYKELAEELVSQPFSNANERLVDSEQTITINDQQHRDNCKIVKNINSSDYIEFNSDVKDLKSIDDYEQEIIDMKEQARLDEILRRERQREIVIETINLADADVFVPISERRVSYRRTFGITDSKRRDIEKYTTIALLGLTGFLALVSFLISKVL